MTAHDSTSRMIGEDAHHLADPSWPQQRADGFARARAFGRWMLAAASIVVFGLVFGFVLFAWSAGATEPHTTYTASATQLVITYGAGADSVDVNVRYPDGTGFNHHPNRSAAVGEVLTLSLTELPAWVQVHSTDCHLGEPGSPGYGTDCRFVETPAPEATTPVGPEPEPTGEPSTEPPADPGPEIYTVSDYARDCAGVITEATTTYTTPVVLVDGQWIPDVDNTTSVTEYRTVTAAPEGAIVHQEQPCPTGTSTSEPTTPTAPSAEPSEEPSNSPSELTPEPSSEPSSPTPVSTNPTPTSPVPAESTTTGAFRSGVSAVDNGVPAGMKHAVLATTGVDPWLLIAVAVAAPLVGAIALGARRGGRR
ncbi:hypothetical protein [Cellulomonas sp. RIT-PI-Y]|uniref:hypothetical protein n=1 Tax=Cellulomonas sp. RIT-PI-Y TaxID=3035297 RepID=UPI0021DA9C6B|nr:hypothetical protein [Cellulomonas sp. RIT-PI-Y]